ncbi:polyprenyl synthetase family protein [Micromonospora terminaliae]|uniref:Polyprenyl synthetase family protein n=1 Tax=Micromonospora terminaliae TaxID=1914461 RepID=A0AAJ3DLG2_9ACTN|nr:polyprenyl synthetase family protein [Micromonospora terminaliae]NES28115.1 polyprenyl synthetase family protein [Micromonospora terminaliae]
MTGVDERTVLMLTNSDLTHDRLFLDAVEQMMLAELDRWDWGPVPELRRMVASQLTRGGKRLRPLLAWTVAEAYGRSWQDIVAPATSVELYHLASLVLDDVQDNSDVRRGRPALHTTAATSTAINVAAVTRSLSYHLIHRCDGPTPQQKLALHRELDTAATCLVMGQSIDIGWGAGWYGQPADFPYLSMVRWKTGSLFGCAAAMGAVIAGAPDTDTVRDFGLAFGSFYQGVDDYLDTFGDETVLGRPRLEDFRGGKLNAPLLRLLDVLTTAGDGETVKSIRDGLGDRDASWEWLLDLMHRHGIADALRRDLAQEATHLAAEHAANMPTGRSAGMARLIDTVMRRAGIPWQDPAITAHV